MAAKRSSSKRRADAAKRLTTDEIDRIVELKHARLSVRQIAGQVGCSPNTVTKHWHDWLDATGEARRDQLERKRTETIEQLDSNAAEARRSYTRARLTEHENESLDAREARQRAEARFLAAERQALRDLARIAGYDAPLQVTATFTTISDDEARAALRDLDV